MSFMEDLLVKLREFDALRDGEAGKDGKDKVAKECLDAIPPEYADTEVFARLSQKLQDALRKRGISRFYRHQAEAILKALEGGNVVLQAPTASGKSLAFQVPMLESLLREANGHALMLYPTKALALDQREQLMSLSEHIPDRKIGSWWYYGDTDGEHRELIRKNPPHILITTPEMLNLSFLGWAKQWQKFFRGLKWVIIDEIHEYRGYFGSNISLLLRRFSHHLAQQGVHPKFFLSSATCANAKEHAENLAGMSFQEVNANNQFRPKRRFYFIQPDIPDYKYWDILRVRTVNAGLACLASEKSVLVFCPTRKFAEGCHSTAQGQVKNSKLGEAHLDLKQIAVFRAGLSMDDRHSIQNGLKDGSVKLVFATNALELGIDIGRLDGVILAGFPDNMMSAWQRIGRAGRDWQSDAFVLYYARNNPLDRFYASNLKAFLNKPLDTLVVNPENEDLIARHVRALLSETPKLDGGRNILGKRFYNAADEKLKSGAQPVQYPHKNIDIRGGGSGSFNLKYGSETIGSLSSYQQFREAYPRAIYMHGGKRYRVEGVFMADRGGEITLGKVEQYLATNAKTYMQATEQEIYNGRQWTSGITAHYGKVATIERMSVKEINEHTGAIINRWVPDHPHSVKYGDAQHACWLHLKAPIDFDKAAAGVTALQHLLRIGAVFSIPLDAHDIFPLAVKGQGMDFKAYIVESYPGGIGIAREVFERWQELLKLGIRIAKECNCKKGCPNCIVPPRKQGELDKVAGIVLAHALLKATERAHDREIVKDLWEPVG